MEDFEVCTFCGETFKGKQNDHYQKHYNKCRDSYQLEFDEDDSHGNFYLFGDN